MTKRAQKRRRARFEKQFRSGEYVEYIRRQPCIVPGCTNPSEACHAKRRNGLGETWRHLFPACHDHHMEQHAVGIHTWSDRHGIDPFAKAAEMVEGFPLDRDPSCW